MNLTTRLVLVGALAATACGSTPAPVPPPPTTTALPPRPTGALATLAPSQNAGRRGTYFVRSGIAMHDFWVRVPDSYSDQNPGGLLIFFHGHGRAAKPEEHGKAYGEAAWDKPVCDRFNLICVHASFGDGMDSGDQENKVAAGKWVIAQVLADYKIVPGRGIASAFSNGGRPLKELLHQLGEGNKAGVPGPAFPFSTVAMYSTVVQPRRLLVPRLPAINWFHYVGELEWPFVNIGADALPLYATMAADAGAPVDLNFWLRPGIGHEMPKEDMTALVAETFARGDTFLAPFVYEPDFNAPALTLAVRAAAELRMGDAHRLLLSLLQGNAQTLDASVRTQADRLKALLQTRTDKVLSTLAPLAEQDPFLAARLIQGPLAGQFQGHPREDTLASILKGINATAAHAQITEQSQAWLQNVLAFSDHTPRIKPESVDQVKALHAVLPPQSQVARIVKNFLDLGVGRLGPNPVPKPAVIAHIQNFVLDGAGSEWKRIKPMPAPLEKKKVSFLRLAWDEAGLHGLAEIPDKTLTLGKSEKWAADYVQVFLEKDFRREGFMHEHAAEYYFAPATEGAGGPGRTRIARGPSQSAGLADEHVADKDAETALACAWMKTARGYTLEFTIPASELAPATLAAGTALGLNFAINDQGEPIQQYHANKRENHIYATPKAWGALKLAD